jgi:hypothetical protein
MFSVGKITKYWLILFKIEVRKIILFVPMTGKKLINGHILKRNLEFWFVLSCECKYSVCVLKLCEW